MKNVLRFCAALLSLVLVAAYCCPSQALAVAHYLAPAHGAAVLVGLTGLGTGALTACVITPLVDIVADECPNAGGLTDIFVMRRRDVDTFPVVDADKVTLSTAIVPKTGCGFVKWDFAQDTGDVNHKSAGDIGTQSISHDLGVYIPRGSASTDAVIQSALNGDMLVACRDSNGNLRLLGDKYRGVKFDYDYKSGKKGTDKNGSDFKFSGEGFTHVPYYLTAALPLQA